VIGTDGRGLDSPYWKDTLPIVSGEKYDVLVKINTKKDAICVSCRLGKGLSIAHDHNLHGQASGGKYPRGPLTVFTVEEPRAAGGVAGAGGTKERAAGCGQDEIAGGMAMAIVHVLEAIEVGDRERERRPVAVGAGALFGEAGVEVARVLERGELVGHGGFGEM